MQVKFIVTKEERKMLVSAISELTGWASAYKGAPSFAFAVNNYIIDRYGTLIYDERTENEDIHILLTKLLERGFVFEGSIDEIAPTHTSSDISVYEESVHGEDDAVTVMEIKFTVTKEERKMLVSAISELTGWASVYKGAPSFAFVVNNYIIDRYGTLIYDDRTENEDVRNLLIKLSEKGFVFEGSIDEIVPTNASSDIPICEKSVCGRDTSEFVFEGSTDETLSDIPIYEKSVYGADAFNVTKFAHTLSIGEVFDKSDKVLIPSEAFVTSISDNIQDVEKSLDKSVFDEGSSDMETSDLSSEAIETTSSVMVSEVNSYEDGKLVIKVTFDNFTRTALDNLDKLIEGKSKLMMKAFGTDSLPVERTETTISFPWFSASASSDDIDAYTRFIYALCDMAKRQKRVTMKEAIVDSEKFAFRCFLLRLGFIGNDFKVARKVLLANLDGNGSFKSR